MKLAPIKSPSVQFDSPTVRNGIPPRLINDIFSFGMKEYELLQKGMQPSGKRSLEKIFHLQTISHVLNMKVMLASKALEGVSFAVRKFNQG